MGDMEAAYHIGWVSGFGLGAIRTLGVNAPFPTHTPWTNYVPAWVDDADRPKCNGGPHQERFKAGFFDGIKAATDNATDHGLRPVDHVESNGVGDRGTDDNSAIGRSMSDW